MGSTVASSFLSHNKEVMFFMQAKNDCSRADVAQAIEDPNAIIIDCRTHGEVAEGKVAGAIVKDWMGGELHAAIGDLDKSKSYYLYCRSGNRSGQAARFMKSHGFERVFNAGAASGLAGL